MSFRGVFVYRGSMLLALGAVLSACSSGGEESPPQDWALEGEQTFGSSIQGLGSCGDVPYLSCTVAGGNPFSGSANDGFTYAIPTTTGWASLASPSPNALYNPACCTDMYILEATNVANRQLYFSVYWADTPLDFASCQAAGMFMAVYKKTSGAWDSHGATLLRGHWGSGCYFMYEFPEVPGLAPSPANQAVRVVAQARVELGGVVKKRVGPMIVLSPIQ